MNKCICFIIFPILITGLLMASENTTSPDRPVLIVQPSKYIRFTSSGMFASEEAIQFEGSFFVAGKGIYGHFDLAAYDNSGKVILVIKSNDQAYRKDIGSKIKSIRLSSKISFVCSKVEVTFHEMRLEPNAGACISK